MVSQDAVITFNRPLAVTVTPKSYDSLIDVGGGGDATVIQTGLDQHGDNFTAFIKSGTYAAGFTEASSDVRIFIEPGTIIQAAITLAGDNITLVIGSGSAVQARITLSGNNCRLLCLNGVDIIGVTLSGDRCIADGGGWNSLTIVSAGDALILSGDDCIARNISVQTATGGSAGDAVVMSGARTSLIATKVLDGDDDAILLSGTDGLIQGCIVLGADSIGIDVTGPRARIVGTHVIATAGIGIALTATGDDSVVSGCIIQDATGDPIDIAADGENCVVVGNRTDGAVDDNSGTSTVADNDESAF